MSASLMRDAADGMKHAGVTVRQMAATLEDSQMEALAALADLFDGAARLMVMAAEEIDDLGGD